MIDLYASTVTSIGHRYTDFAATAALDDIDFTATCQNGSRHVSDKIPIISTITTSLM